MEAEANGTILEPHPYIVSRTASVSFTFPQTPTPIPKGKGGRERGRGQKGGERESDREWRERGV
jgi:hypothetical protein